jgi:hypothetical protein
MKKKTYILVLSIFLSSCASLSDLTKLIASPTPIPAADTSTPVPSITPAPTQNPFATATSTPLTFTPTPTQLGAELFTPTGTVTDEPFPTPGLPPAAINGNLFTPVSVGFLSVLISNNVLYWNEGPCMPRDIKFAAFVQDTINTDKVLLFTRLRQKSNTLNITDWNSGAIMIKNPDNGSYTYDLHTWNLRRYYYFKQAWIEYQLIAVTEDMDVIGRTQIYDRNASLVQCASLAVP